MPFAGGGGGSSSALDILSVTAPLVFNSGTGNLSISCASATAAGVVEQATANETFAGTSTGGSGCPIFINPSTMFAANTMIVGSATSNITDIYLGAGTSVTGATGSILVSLIATPLTSASGQSVDGISLEIVSGDGSAGTGSPTTGAGGAISLRAGSAGTVAGAATSAAGGGIDLTTGDAAAGSAAVSPSSGGALVFTTGAAAAGTGPGGARGGDIRFNLGAGVNSAGTGHIELGAITTGTRTGSPFTVAIGATTSEIPLVIEPADTAVPLTKWVAGGSTSTYQSFTTTAHRMSSAISLAWASSTDADGTLDTGLTRSSAGITKFTNGSSGNGGFLSQLGSQVVGHANEVQLTIQGNATQTANLMEWKNSAGVVYAAVPASALSGASNTLFGSGAGSALTTGAGDTIIGYQAGLNITTSGATTIVGASAGQNLSAGFNNNTFVGYISGQASTGASDNTFIGSNSGRDNTTGDNNTAIGSGAGSQQTTAGNNTFLGYRAGLSADTGGSNICIGSSADLNAITTASAIVIGTSSYGESNSVIIGMSLASSTANDFIVTSGDTGIARSSAGILKFTAGGGTGNGGFLGQKGSSVVGSADEIQFLIKGNATQTANNFEIQASTGAKLLTHSGTSSPELNCPQTTRFGNSGSGAVPTADANADVVIYLGTPYNINLSNRTGIVWWSNSPISGSNDVGLARLAAGVLQVTNGTTVTGGSGSLVIGTSSNAVGTSGVGVLVLGNGTVPSSSPANEAQLFAKDSAAGNSNLFCLNEAAFTTQLTGLDVALSSDFTDTSATLTNTALSLNLENGVTYAGVIVIFATDSTAADGMKIDFSGGTATASNFRAHTTVEDTTGFLTNSQTTALNTAVTAATLTGASLWIVNFTITTSAAGTFIVRAAQNAHTTGTLTVNKGTYMWLRRSG